MANEGTLVLKYEDPIDFTVADGTGITKGAILKLTDPRTAAASDGDSDYVAGIAARDKVANDGRTRLAVFRRGVFRLMASGSIVAGQSVATHSSTGGANVIAASTTKPCGVALEDTSGNELIEVELNAGAAAQA